jgi:hypothetical protein
LLVCLVWALWVLPACPYASAFALATGHLSTQVPSAGHISGQLLDGSRQNAPVANQSVTLQLAQGQTARDLLSLTTDAQGRYAFGGLQSDASEQYALYTLYQGAQYVSDLIDLGKSPVQLVDLTVYDATTVSTNLAVVQASVLLEKPDAQSGRLTVSEDFFFENLGLTTYVGRLDASPNRPNALLFSLPSGASLLSLAAGFDGYNTIQVDGGFASDAAVPPGTSEFSFSFQVPYSGTSYRFTYQAVYPTLSLALLTPTNLLTTPQGLDSQGPTNTKTGTYQLFLVKTLRAHSRVGAQLAGLPALRAQIAPTAFNASLLWLVALLCVLLLLCGVGGYAYFARKSRAARGAGNPGAQRGAPAASKDMLLRELLELDKAYEAGRLNRAAYRERRERVKARLRRMMDGREERGVEPTSQVARRSGREAT